MPLCCWPRWRNRCAAGAARTSRRRTRLGQRGVMTLSYPSAWCCSTVSHSKAVQLDVALLVSTPLTLLLNVVVELT
eukprot:4995036-Pyramimonas_sp.AAC.1